MARASPVFLILVMMNQGAFTFGIANNSTCVSNRGRPYDEKECKDLALAKGCAWSNNTCSCPEGLAYSRRERHCEALGAKQLRSNTILDNRDTNSICVSNRGQPYDEKQCKKFGLAKGCSWNNDTCTCPEGQAYSRHERHCKALRHRGVEATLAIGMRVSDPVSDATCVSNRDQAYDEKQCKESGLAKGCSWNNNSCSCPEGQSYSKRERHCKALGHNGEEEEVASEKVISDPVSDSTCVSNHGQPYDEKQCKELGLAKGCSWKNNTCSCPDGQSYSKRERQCKSLDPSGVEAILASQALSDGVECVAADGSMYNEDVCTRSGGETGCMWMEGTCACVGANVFMISEQRCDAVLV